MSQSGSADFSVVPPRFRVWFKGNTNYLSHMPARRTSPAKRWAFTLNNWTQDEYNSLVGSLDQAGADWVIGQEVGASGTRHLQGVVARDVKWRPLPWLAAGGKRAHWEKCKGTWCQNVKYCTKDGNYTTSDGVDVELSEWVAMSTDQLRVAVTEAAAAEREASREKWLAAGAPPHSERVVSPCRASMRRWAMIHDVLSQRILRME